MNIIIYYNNNSKTDRRYRTEGLRYICHDVYNPVAEEMGFSIADRRTYYTLRLLSYIFIIIVRPPPVRSIRHMHNIM